MSETISIPDGNTWGIPDSTVVLLSKLSSKKGRLQRAVLALLKDWEEEGEIPAAIRFGFYGLEQVGVVSKEVLELERTDGKKGRRPDQDLTEAFTWLRDKGIIPWDWIRDDRRELTVWRYAATVAEYVSETVDRARIDVWDGASPPIILCESAAVAGVLEPLAVRYLCPLSGLSGMTNGFLRTVVAPHIVSVTNKCPWEARILYVGDHDFSGGQIEESARRILSDELDCDLDQWTRIALTEEQLDIYDLRRLIIQKTDKRHAKRGCCPHPAVEAEALRQSPLRRIVEDALTDLVPEPVADVLELQKGQRERVRTALEGTL